MATVNVKVENGKVMVESPYNPQFPAKARELGGKWTGSEWQFDSRDEARVRELCVEIYGTDGTPQELVDVRVKLHPDRIVSADVWAMGREICCRRSRDAAVSMGTGVVLIEGEFGESGGSRRYPEIKANYGKDPDRVVILEVRDVPRQLVDNFAHDQVELVEIVDHEAADDAAAQFANVSDEMLIAALEQRGYKITKEA